MNNDFDIKKINSVIATEILMGNYNIDILKYQDKDIDTVIELLSIIKPNLINLKMKASVNDDTQY